MREGDSFSHRAGFCNSKTLTAHIPETKSVYRGASPTDTDNIKELAQCSNLYELSLKIRRTQIIKGISYGLLILSAYAVIC